MADQIEMQTDMRIQLMQAAIRPVYRVATDTRRVPSRSGLLNDIGAVSGRDNLEQAIILRLLTPRGELAALGHPEYGSRLHSLIGSKNNATHRGLVRLYVLESLGFEPRIAKVLSIEVAESRAERTGVDVHVVVQPVESPAPLSIGPLNVELLP